MSKTRAPSFVRHESECVEERGAYPPPAADIRLSFSRDLGRLAGSKHIGMQRERIPPGCQASMMHAHSEEEELVYVLQGECMLRLIEPGSEPYELELRAGHVASFPAGTGIAHTLFNRGVEDCVVLSIGERKPGVDRVFYPENSDFDASVAHNRPERHWSRSNVDRE